MANQVFSILLNGVVVITTGTVSANSAINTARTYAFTNNVAPMTVTAGGKTYWKYKVA